MIPSTMNPQDFKIVFFYLNIIVAIFSNAAAIPNPASIAIILNSNGSICKIIK